MTVATALVSGNDPLPQLAEQAVGMALKKAGLAQANGVLLFLTPDFARHAQTTITAVARAAQCMQVAGGIAAGVFTEEDWVLDRPAAAAMVFGRGMSLMHPDEANKLEAPILCYTGGAFPENWGSSPARFGGSFTGTVGYADPVAWQQSRLDAQQRCSIRVLGARASLGVSSGLRLLGKPQRITGSAGYDLQKLGRYGALDSLSRALPPEYRERPHLPLHRLMALLIGTDDLADAQSALAAGQHHPIAIVAANSDGSLTLSERTVPGQYLAWAIRQPLSAETDMRQALARLAEESPAPSCALMFSCIGRGPYFYGGEDRDRGILCDRFPGLPLLGIYGTGQIAPATAATNRQLQNAVVTALLSKHSGKEAHVQSIA